MADKEVDTLLEDEENKDTEVIEENNDDDNTNDTTDNTDIDDNSDSGNDGGDDDTTNEEIDPKNVKTELLNSLNDDEFAEFMESGKLPADKVKQFKEKSKDDGTSTSSSSTEGGSDSETSNSISGSGTGKKDAGAEKSAKEEKSSKDSTSEEGTKEGQTKRISNYKIAYEKIKADYDNIFKPFKANGKEITPKTVDDVIQLMQMGANYTKKMQIIAEMKKTIESLNTANIRENDLNFLIDVNNGDVEAIKKLLTKHNIDPMDLDMESTNYVPKDNIISDGDAEFSTMLDDIREHLPEIQDILNNKWDKQSKGRLLKDPNLMKALAEEIEYGRFDEVQKILDNERTFGRYKNVADVDAYIDIVTKLVANQKTNTTTPNKNNNPTNTSKKDIPDKSKAAPTGSKGNAGGKATITPRDILNMSDEDFNKLSVNDLY